MSNPARAPVESSVVGALHARNGLDAYVEDAAGMVRSVKAGKAIEAIQRVLAPLDMEVVPAITIRMDQSVDPRVFHKGSMLALADNGGLTFRKRSAEAMSLANHVFEHLPLTGPHGRDNVRSRMQDRVLADAGSVATLGRFTVAYPKRGVPSPSRPVSRAEAQAAIRRSGLVLEAGRVKGKALPLNDARQDGRSITVNPNSDNGFPVGTKWNYPGAASKVMSLALGLRKILEAPGTSVWDEIRRLEATEPALVAFKGKGKADYYSADKLRTARMRFYNAPPRQCALIMQQASQVLESEATSVLDSPTGHSGIGITLVRGGADDLIVRLDEMLKMEGSAYVHVGDDSWVAVRVGSKIVMFALDCSNFDITQHGDVTLEVHRAIRDELAKVDRVSADTWYALARERIVVVAGTVTRRLRHAGPSGMPLQSKVNDVLMDVMINRLLAEARPEDYEDAERLDKRIQDVGKGMGFAVRLEQMWQGEVGSVREALQRESFLFIGYYFHADSEGQVWVHCDVARTMSQLPYPTLKWESKAEDLVRTEAMRLGSIAMNLGVPTPELQPAFSVFRQDAVNLVEKVLSKAGADIADERLRWAVQENPWGPKAEPSLRGLLRVLQRDPKRLWGPEDEMESASTFVPIEGGWADEVEREEMEERILGREEVRAIPHLEAARIVRKQAPTHPVTTRNDGRPPPTAIWGPPKQKRSPVSMKQVGKGKGKARGNVGSWEESDDSFEFSDDEY